MNMAEMVEHITEKQYLVELSACMFEKLFSFSIFVIKILKCASLLALWMAIITSSVLWHEFST